MPSNIHGHIPHNSEVSSLQLESLITNLTFDLISRLVYVTVSKIFSKISNQIVLIHKNSFHGYSLRYNHMVTINLQPFLVLYE